MKNVLYLKHDFHPFGINRCSYTRFLELKHGVLFCTRSLLTMLYDLTELRSLFGEDIDALNELLNNFSVDASVSLDKINEACLTGDVPVIKAELHKFMGIVTSLQIFTIKDRLKYIEREINERGLDDANLGNIKLITDTISKVITHLKNETIA